MVGYVVVFFLTTAVVALGSGLIKVGFESFGDNVLKAVGMLVVGIAICAGAYFGVSHFWNGPLWAPIAGVVLGLIIGIGS